ncbi:MAG: hypothetical protein OEQ53_03925 [Saprospiraceae bacterium]|nr:hypothetical protein [Saprospiraceae bacterium]
MNDLEKIDEEEKLQFSAILATGVLEYVSRWAAFSTRTRLVKKFTVSPVIAMSILWK